MSKIYFCASPDSFLADEKSRSIFNLIFSKDKFEAAKKESSFAQSYVLIDDIIFETIDGSVQLVSEVGKCLQNCIDSLKTISLFGDKKVVWLRNVNFMGDSILGRSQETKDAIEYFIKYLKDSIESTKNNHNSANWTLIISVTPVDRRTRNYKWFQENTESFFVENDSKNIYLDSIFDKQCATFGLKFDSDARQIFYQKLGRDPRAILQSIELIYCFLGKSGVVNSSIVRQIIPEFPSEEFFEIVETFYEMDIKEFQFAMKRYFSANKEIRPILATFQNRNRLLIQIKSLVNSQEIQSSQDGVYFSQNKLQSLAQKYSAVFPDCSKKSSFCLFSQNPWYLSKISKAINIFSLKQLIDLQMSFNEILKESLNPNWNQKNSLFLTLSKFFTHSFTEKIIITR